jgi:Family of unknown function (DUF5947)
MSDGVAARVKLADLARSTRDPVLEGDQVPSEACELCGEPVPVRHRHLIDVHDRRLLCACRPCSILFDHRGAGGGHYRLLPERSRYLTGFDLDDRLWQGFGIPVDLAFFFHSSATDRLVAFYPAPAGATESLLELDVWDELVERNPVLDELEPDVEALLVNRTRGARDHWLVPVDRCYELVGLIRLHWRGLGGGEQVRAELDRFFDRLGKGGA